MMKKMGVLFFSGFLWLGCQQAPTKVYESKPVQLKEEKKETSAAQELRVSEKSFIVDARNPFDYAISHLNGSISLRPDEFTQTELPFKGLLDVDRFALTRRLARKGISPETPVVVVGKGLGGHGEEGRMAWTLKLLGVKDVQFASIEAFSLPLTNAEAPPKEAVPLWRPQGDESLEVVKEEFLRASHVSRTALSAAIILDVRPVAEYLGKVKVFDQEVPDLSAINIPWTEFFDQKGLAKTSVKEHLNQVGISTMRIVYVISNQGAESAAVTLVLRELGFLKTANFAGGYRELIYGGKKKSKTPLRVKKKSEK